MELDHIRLTDQADPAGYQMKAPHGASRASSGAFPVVVCPTMEMPSLNCELILGPQPLDVDQRTLARTEAEVL